MDVVELVSRVDGFVLTGESPMSNRITTTDRRFPPDEPIDPGRDALVLPLVRACIAARVPVFGILPRNSGDQRGLGGSLYYRIHELPGKDDHRRPRGDDVPPEEAYRLKHAVRLTPGGLFRSLAGQDEVMVNSLHGQGVDRLGEGLVVEATSLDG
jgi:putative glutamine amidotransferase